MVVAEGYQPHTTDLGDLIDAMDIGFTTASPSWGTSSAAASPSAFDRMLSTRFGVKAVEFLLAGQSNVMAGLNGREITPSPSMT